MMRTRFRRTTLYPRCSHIRRICRFNPWVRTIRNWRGPVCSTSHRRVTVPRMGTPPAMSSTKDPRMGRSTVT